MKDSANWASMKESNCCGEDKGQPGQEEVEVMIELFPSCLGGGMGIV